MINGWPPLSYLRTSNVLQFRITMWWLPPIYKKCLHSFGTFFPSLPLSTVMNAEAPLVHKGNTCGTEMELLEMDIITSIVTRTFTRNNGSSQTFVL